MNRDEAKAISTSNGEGPPNVSAFIYALDDIIRAQARRGGTRIAPWELLRRRQLPTPTEREKAAIEAHYTSEGFVWLSDISYPSLSW